MKKKQNKTDQTIKFLRGPSEDMIIRCNVMFYNRKKTSVEARDPQRTSAAARIASVLVRLSFPFVLFLITVSQR